jgi:tetratricopeptide (TPR) repeat protein
MEERGEKSGLEPNTAEVYANLGRVYFRERKFDQAVDSLQRAVHLKPDLAKADALLAMSLSEVGRYRDALPGLEKSFRQPVDPALKRLSGLQLMRAYTGLQRDSKAVELALELNRLYPNDPEVLYHKARIFANSAYLTMQRLAQVAPNSVWRHQAAAEAYQSQGSYNQAIREYHEVLALEPQRPGIHFHLGRALLLRSQQRGSDEDVTGAEKEFEREPQIDPANANAAYELAEIHRNAGQLEEAQKSFERALKYYPDFEDANLGLASVLVRMNRPDVALPYLQKAIAINPDSDVAWYRLSEVYRALGNEAEQRKAISQFQRLHKTEQQAATGMGSPPSEITKQRVDSNKPE